MTVKKWERKKILGLLDAIMTRDVDCVRDYIEMNGGAIPWDRSQNLMDPLPDWVSNRWEHGATSLIKEACMRTWDIDICDVVAKARTGKDAKSDDNFPTQKLTVLSLFGVKKMADWPEGRLSDEEKSRVIVFCRELFKRGYRPEPIDYSSGLSEWLSWFDGEWDFMREVLDSADIGERDDSWGFGYEAWRGGIQRDLLDQGNVAAAEFLDTHGFSGALEKYRLADGTTDEVVDYLASSGTVVWLSSGDRPSLDALEKMLARGLRISELEGSDGVEDAVRCGDIDLADFLLKWGAMLPDELVHMRPTSSASIEWIFSHNIPTKIALARMENDGTFISYFKPSFYDPVDRIALLNAAEHKIPLEGELSARALSEDHDARLLDAFLDYCPVEWFDPSPSIEARDADAIRVFEEHGVHTSLKKITDGNPFVEEGESSILINVPAGVEEIGEDAFRTGLGAPVRKVASLELPDGLRDIGEGAFWGLEIERVSIPVSVARVCCGAFYGTKRIEVYDTIDSLEYGESGYPEGADVSSAPGLGWACVGIEKGSPLTVWNARKSDFEVVVRSSKTGEVLYKVWEPVKSSKNEVANVLLSSWGKNSSFAFKRLDSVFDELANADSKVRTAINRVAYPVDLDDATREKYVRYLSRQAKKTVEILCETDDSETFEKLSSVELVKSSNKSALYELAKSSPKMLAALTGGSENAADGTTRQGESAKPSGVLIAEAVTAMRDGDTSGLHAIRDIADKVSPDTAMELLWDAAKLDEGPAVDEVFDLFRQFEFPAVVLSMAVRKGYGAAARALLRHGVSFDSCFNPLGESNGSKKKEKSRAELYSYNVMRDEWASKVPKKESPFEGLSCCEAVIQSEERGASGSLIMELADEGLLDAGSMKGIVIACLDGSWYWSKEDWCTELASYLYERGGNTSNRINVVGQPRTYSDLTPCREVQKVMPERLGSMWKPKLLEDRSAMDVLQSSLGSDEVNALVRASWDAGDYDKVFKESGWLGSSRIEEYIGAEYMSERVSMLWDEGYYDTLWTRDPAIFGLFETYVTEEKIRMRVSSAWEEGAFEKLVKRDVLEIRHVYPHIDRDIAKAHATGLWTSGRLNKYWKLDKRYDWGGLNTEDFQKLEMLFPFVDDSLVKAALAKAWPGSYKKFLDGSSIIEPLVPYIEPEGFKNTVALLNCLALKGSPESVALLDSWGTKLPEKALGNAAKKASDADRPEVAAQFIALKDSIYGDGASAKDLVL